MMSSISALLSGVSRLGEVRSLPIDTWKIKPKKLTAEGAEVRRGKEINTDYIALRCNQSIASVSVPRFSPERA